MHSKVWGQPTEISCQRISVKWKMWASCWHLAATTLFWGTPSIGLQLNMGHGDRETHHWFLNEKKKVVGKERKWLNGSQWVINLLQGWEREWGVWDHVHKAYLQPPMSFFGRGISRPSSSPHLYPILCPILSTYLRGTQGWNSLLNVWVPPSSLPSTRLLSYPGERKGKISCTKYHPAPIVISGFAPF